jgi:hypothetical protein
VPDKSVADKLLVKPGYRVLIVDPPGDYLPMMGDLPPGAILLKKATPETDLIQVFLTSKKEMEQKLPVLKTAMKPGELLWATYPKGTSKVKTDINRDIIASYVRTIGLVGVAMISIDDTWAALRLRPIKATDRL